VAREFFHTLQRGEKLHLEDGRRFVHRTTRKYDFIILDVPTIDSFPFHLFSRESFEAMRAALKPGGILAVNVIACLRGRRAIGAISIHKTLRAVFPHIESFSAHYDPDSQLGNVIFFASGGKLSLPPSAVTDDAEERRIALPTEGGIVVEDNFNPLDSLFAETSLEYRKPLRPDLGAGTVLD
jgi:spermidine synthase